ncbi:uncharacterized protein G2W53_009954 [Senna tora]|uniref:Uncharacterized protein n=1 Tax=Senna tora TaxID=362788 RepID=A0A835CAR3_9FABA|nr:uncharacterized protein G2W53_009954 [Senna tora]
MLRLESCWHGRSVDHVLTYSGRQIAVGSKKTSRITRQKTCCASESNTSVRVVFGNRSGFDAPIGVVLAWEERGSFLNIFQTANRGRISETFTNYEAKDLLRKNIHKSRGKRLVAQISQTRRFAQYSRTGVVLMLRFESSWHGRSVDHVLTYSGQQIAGEFQKPSSITRQKTCCASESNTSVRTVFTNRSGFDAPIGVVLAWEERGSCHNIFRTTNHGTGVLLLLRLESSWHGRSVDHVLTYFGRQITFGSHKPSRITRQKTCCASESNTSVRVVFANRSAFDAPIGVVMAWEERGSCLNIFRTTNRGLISETMTNYEAKDLLRKVVLMLRLESSWHGRSVDHVLTYSGKRIVGGSQKPSLITRKNTSRACESNTSVRTVFSNQQSFDAPIGVVLAWEERGSCLNIFRTTNHGRISETYTYYEVKDLLRNLDELRGKRLVAQVSQTRRFALYSRTGVVLMLRLESSWQGRSVDHVLTYSGRQIAVGSQKLSRITTQKTCCASESNSSVRAVFENQSGFDAPIGVVLAWDERGSCANIFPTTNRSRISETFTNYEAKDLLRKNLHELRRKRLVAQASQTRGFALYSRTGVVLMLRLESSSHGRSVDHVLTYSGRQIAVGSQKPSRITSQKTCCASESNTSVRVVFANQSGFDAPIGVVFAWEERGSCPNIFRTTNRGRISETFTNYEAKHLLRKQKTCCATESNTSVLVVFANGSGFDAPIGVVLAWEERGSCLNIFRTTNRGRITETFMNYEAKDSLRKSVKHVGAWIMSQHISDDKSRSDLINLHELRGKRLVAQVSQPRRSALYSRPGVFFMLRLESSWHGRSVDHVSTYFGRQIVIGSQKPSRIKRQKTCCASESNTSVRVVFAKGSGFDAPIGVVLAWEERGSCLNIFRMTNRGRILETFTNYEAKDSLRKSVDHVLTYSGRQIAVGSQKPSRITRQKTCCASESNTSVRVVFANRSGFDGPIGVVLAWEERGSCLNIFRTTNRGWISETFTNHVAKGLLRKLVKHVGSHSIREPEWF